jgi:hypothetical protein
MAAADDPAPCPHGHDDTVRLLPTVGVLGRAAAGRGSGRTSDRTSPRTSGTAAPAGGCCGGGCCG